MKIKMVKTELPYCMTVDVMKEPVVVSFLNSIKAE